MKTKIITLLFAFFMPFVAIADTTSPATDNDATGKIATLSYQDILNIERNKTDCATGVFAAALERTATADLETANKIDIDNWVRAAFSEKETLEGSRGGVSYNNIHIHSVRMPGYIASQEVLFGASGQILTIRHDSMNRECYMPDVLMAVRHVIANKNFVYGLENIME